MVRLNSNQLSSQQIERLWLQLAEMAAPKSSTHTAKILREILGHEERIMVAKRLAAAVLLVEGLTPYRIADELKLSQATIHAIREKVEAGGFSTSLQYISKTKKDYFSFLDTLDKILHLGGLLPHYNGIDRYPWHKHK